MEFLLDTVNLEEIKTYAEIIPISGITSNPSIVKKEEPIEFFQHMRAIRNIIGQDKSLHVQVVAADYDGILADAEAILKNIDDKVFVKVPVSSDGLKAIRVLKEHGVSVTATAIYTKMQAYLAIAAGADYLAPYYNRMENLNIDPKEVIREVAKEIERTGSRSKILAASFKNVDQVNAALEAGAQASTVGVDVMAQAFEMPSISKAVADFISDWESIYGEHSTIADL
ncbi:fructose-6-phosphate aldolase [Streptococcus merionis]|nr:fructose-6-phosphate aldolase [Streptococcus merionis]